MVAVNQNPETTEQAATSPAPQDDLGLAQGVVVEDCEARVGSGQGVAMLFTAPWCTAATPLRSQLTKASPLAHPIVEVDVDQHPHLADRYLVVSIPALVFFADGREQGRLIGAFGPGKVRSLLRRGQTVDRTEVDDNAARPKKRGKR